MQRLLEWRSKEFFSNAYTDRQFRKQHKKTNNVEQTNCRLCCFINRRYSLLLAFVISFLPLWIFFSFFFIPQLEYHKVLVWFPSIFDWFLSLNTVFGKVWTQPQCSQALIYKNWLQGLLPTTGFTISFISISACLKFVSFFSSWLGMRALVLRWPRGSLID